jgi:hypothetical protein
LRRRRKLAIIVFRKIKSTEYDVSLVDLLVDLRRHALLMTSNDHQMIVLKMRESSPLEQSNRQKRRSFSRRDESAFSDRPVLTFENRLQRRNARFSSRRGLEASRVIERHREFPAQETYRSSSLVALFLRARPANNLRT